MTAIFDKLLDIVLSPFALNIDSFEEVYGGLFSEITSNIYIGARPDEISVPELEKAGITHVVSCLNEEERSGVEFLEQDFEHLFLGVHDGMHEDIAAKFPQFFDFTANLTHCYSNSKLFVHCGAGVSRSATLVIAQLMKLETKRFFDAYKSVRSRRSQVLPNIGFASQLQRLENDLLAEERTNSPSSLALYLHQVCNLPADVEVIQSALEQNSFDAVAATMAIFGGEIPRVMQGVRP
ncbi:MAG: dual specificity protein phosphatase family protein [Desulfobacterales bacterium]|nr:dual specificity protein phosphatase family protein [Desulfobacterales bacterium]